MKVNVRIESDFSKDSNGEGIGECLFDEGRLRINWIQPAGEGEALGAKYSLTYDSRTHVLEVERFCDHISRMAFCEGVKTRGELQTTEGCFATEIFTHRLDIPETGFGRTELLYDLISDGQEPISNMLAISVYEVGE